MKKITLTLPDGVPETEISREFLQGMVSRMAQSYFKYGTVADAYPRKIDAMASGQVRRDKYRGTGNLEFLMDSSNFDMIEFMHPRNPEAHFRATSSAESPGRKWSGEAQMSTRGNKEF